MDFSCEICFIKFIGRAVQNLEHILTKHWNWLVFAQRIEFFQCAANIVHNLDLFANCLISDGNFKMRFEFFFQLDDFFGPQFQCNRALGVWKFHGIYRLKLAQIFIHLLFAITGGFTNNQVREVEVRAFVGFCKTIAGFNQWTKISWKVFFCFRNGFIRSGAQTNNAGTHCHGKFLWEIGTECADEWDVFLFHLVSCEERFFAHLSKIVKNFRQFFFDLHT